MDKTIISILAGLGGMFGWGTSDFLANNASEKVGHAKTFLWSQLAGVTLIFILVLLISPSFTLTPLLAILAVISGLAYALGYLFFYKGFEIGNVSVVSAVINFQVIFIIAISFFIYKQTLTFLQIPALLLLLLGITFVSVNFNDIKKGSLTLLKGVKETLIATVMFGVFFYPLNEFIVERADWLTISFITKLTAIIAVFLMYSFRRQSLIIKKISRKVVVLIAAIGLLEALAVLSVTYGQSYGDGIIVAPISSALTVVTVGLAMVFLKEKITRLQALGITMTIIGIVLTAF